MGRDKALLPCGGHTMLEDTLRKVAVVAMPVAIIAPRDRYAESGYPTYPDLRPGCGPLGGLETVLTLDLADWNLVLACDMPGLTNALLAALVERIPATPEESACVAARGPTGLEPLCAIYHRSCLAHVRNALDHRRLKARSLLAEFNPIAVDGFPPELLANVNTPAEWAAAGARR